MKTADLVGKNPGINIPGSPGWVCFLGAFFRDDEEESRAPKRRDSSYVKVVSREIKMNPHGSTAWLAWFGGIVCWRLLPTTRKRIRGLTSTARLDF